MKLLLYRETLLALTATLVFVLPSSLLLAQTPTPTTTFTANSGNAWTNVANWDVQVPTLADDALIGPNQTAAATSTQLTNAPFGTLTLGSGSTLQLSSANQAGLPSGATVFFSDGSYLQLTAGSINRSANYNVLAGATATFKPGTTSDSIPQGTVTGAVDSVFNIRSLVAPLRLRWSAAGFAGTMNYISDNGTDRQVELSTFGTDNTTVGPGTTVFGDKVYVTFLKANRISNSGTVKLVGGTTGGTITKLAMGSYSDTISNLIIESPAGTATNFSRSTGVLTATNLVTFQGTAATCVLDDTQATPSGNGLVAANMTFGGVGTWILTGDCGISISGGTRTITTDVDAAISNKLTAANGFTKSGTNSLTLGDPSGVATEIGISGGHIVLATSVTFTASDYVLFKGQDTSFGAWLGGSFSDINAVNVQLSPTGNFRKEDGVPGGMSARDNGDGTFTVRMGPPGGTVLTIR